MLYWLFYVNQMCESNSTVIDNFDVKWSEQNCLTLKTWWNDMPSVPRSCGGKKIIDCSNLDIDIELADIKDVKSYEEIYH